MSPTSYCHFARSILRAIGSATQTDRYGVPTDLVLPNPWEYTDADSFRTAWLGYNLLRKALPEGLPREFEDRQREKAIADFFMCEEGNARLNATGLPRGLSRPCAMMLLRARQIVHETLGKAPDIPRVLRNGRRCKCGKRKRRRNTKRTGYRDNKRCRHGTAIRANGRTKKEYRRRYSKKRSRREKNRRCRHTLHRSTYKSRKCRH